MAGPRAMSPGAEGARNWEEMDGMEQTSIIEQASVTLCRAKIVDEETGAAKSSVITEFCFVPSTGKPMTVKELQDILINKWKLDQPNMIINCDAGSMHPKALATMKLSAQPQFDEWMRQSEAQLKKTMTRDDIDLSNPEVVKEQSNIVINQLIFQRLLTIFSAVLDAASLSNNWIIINRANPAGSSATAEFMLELAMQQTSQRPVVIVIESLNRLRRFTNEDAENQIASLNNLATNAVPVNQYSKEDAEPVKFAASYNIEEFDSYTDWTALDLPTNPHKADLLASTGTVNERAMWGYHYQSCLFSSGTHYIILDGEESSFPVQGLGEIGYVCAHGSTRAYQRLRGVIQAGRPLVMLNNTGGCTQAFASLHKAMMQSQQEDLKLTSNELLDKIEIMNNVDQWTQTFGIPEIMMFRELMQRAPMLFQKTIVVVDLVKDSAEEVLSTVTGAFASSSTGVPELGIGDAESAVVYNAWKRHMVLYANCTRQRRRGNIAFMILLILGVATASLSTIYANISDMHVVTSVFNSTTLTTTSTSNFDLDDTKYKINAFIILLPIAAALIGQIITRERYNEKWKICDMAESMIVSEIYHFRASTGPYGSSGFAEVDEGDDSGGGGGGGGSDASKKRNLFVRRVQSIFAKVMDSDVGKSGALVYGDILREDTSLGIESNFHKKLKKHVEMNLIFTREREKKRDKVKGKPKITSMASKMEMKQKNSTTTSIDRDDLISPITIETYVEYRAKPITLAYERQTPVIANKLSALEITVFVLTSAGAILAIPGIDMGSWVAITVAMSTAVTSYIEFFQLRIERDTRNSSLTEFQNLQTWWESLSIIDKRTKQSKEKALGTIEGGIMTLCERRSGAAFSADDTEEGSEEGEGELKKDN